jgi:glycolate oxidase
LPIDDSLLRIAKGEILDDPWHRLVYSVDASHYQITPEAVVCPVDDSEVQEVCRYSSSKQIPVAARGAGTGLLGQSLSGGIMLDLTKHMNRIIEVGSDYVIAQPGVVKAVLDKELRNHGKFLPPDPASSNYCTLGGMIANNSSGIHCLGYGNTIDFVDGVSLVYADGTEGYADGNEHDERLEKIRSLLFPYSNIIQNGFPKVSKNSCGYRLDSLFHRNSYLPHKLFAASEGTLGIVVKAKLRIIDLPEHRCMLVLSFKDLLGAVSAVPAILRFLPVALEMMDHTVVSGARETRDAGCLLFVEFSGSKALAERRFTECKEMMKKTCLVLEYASDETSLSRIWGARKGALNNIMKLTVGSRKPVGLIEDTVVLPRLLEEHVIALLQEYRQNKMDYVMYGHVGDGNVHTRPLIDLESPAQLKLMNSVADNVFRRVAESGGSITGEHGDGIARSPYIALLYGQAIMNLFQRVKQLLDPRYLLNPGKKVPAAK